MLRFGPEISASLEKERGVSSFEPMEGTIMREYLLLREPVYSDEKQLKKWLDLSRQYLLSLPPKKRKNDIFPEASLIEE